MSITINNTAAMDTRSLAPHGFYKPSSLKHSDILCLHPYKLCTAVMGCQINYPGIKVLFFKEIYSTISDMSC